MTSTFKAEEKLILALDHMNESEVILLLDKLPNLVWVKVGLELFTLLGPEIVFKLKKLGKKVFLDLKFHDIPNTMARACYQAASIGADLITIHSCAGKKALKECKKSSIQGAIDVGLSPPGLLAVTVLTSWEEQEFIDDLDINQSINKRSLLLSDLAFQAGISGCICSPIEAQKLRKFFPEPFLIITPGIRSEGVNRNDQARVMTPLEALKAGSSKLVIGREISLAKDPSKAFKRICEQISY
ncbi:orotidine-5'-phosphate decarboxylase [Prochlorococcus marinus]|uniref:orotidine-5'-phosphate decarboxylase n=1 Tax=Prochlorococcus marinus TaxID=1219 RepID=UPI0022B595B5|nr:orotidine-5'-phosphate decarboxylase [Prochlorococcus marinus]